MLRTKLFQAFAALVLIFGLLSGFVGIRIIKNRVINEAQNQVQQNLGSGMGRTVSPGKPGGDDQGDTKKTGSR